METVLEQIRKERSRQDLLWGGPTHDDTHTWLDWSGFQQSYLGFANGLRLTGEEYYATKVKLAALVVAELEAINRLAEATQ